MSALLCLIFIMFPNPVWAAQDRGSIERQRFESMAGAWIMGARDQALHVSTRQTKRNLMALFIAISENNLKRARIFVPRVKDLNCLDTKTGATPLSWAAQTGTPAICTWLLDLGADIEAADSQGHTPLTTAAAQGRPAAARLLLERGANPDRLTPLGQRALHLACGKKGTLEMVQLLVEYGANPHLPGSSGWTPLTVAAKHGHLDIVEYLLRLGVHPDGAPGAAASPLHWAAAQDHYPVAARLLTAGGSPANAGPNGAIPLDWAKSEAMRLLLTGTTGEDAPDAP